MTKSITVGGIAVTVSAPYAEGHILTEAEAKALNAVRAENIGNNVRKMIKDLQTSDGGTLSDASLATINAKVAEYDAAYTFTLGGTGTGTARVTDPLQKEANSIARAILLEKLKTAGITRKDYGEEKFGAKLAEIAALEKVQTAAKKALAARSKSTDDMDIAI